MWAHPLDLGDAPAALGDDRDELDLPVDVARRERYPAECAPSQCRYRSALWWTTRRASLWTVLPHHPAWMRS